MHIIINEIYSAECRYISGNIILKFVCELKIVTCDTGKPILGCPNRLVFMSEKNQ